MYRDKAGVRRLNEKQMIEGRHTTGAQLVNDEKQRGQADKTAVRKLNGKQRIEG